MLGITWKRRAAVFHAVLAFALVSAPGSVSLAGQPSETLDPTMEKIRSTWQSLADRVQNLRLELEGQETIPVPKAASEGQPVDPDELEPKTVPFAVRVLIKFPRIMVEEQGRGFRVRSNRLFSYTYRDVRYCDGSRLWKHYQPDGPGELPQFETWPSLSTFARTTNYFFSAVGIDILTALLCAPSYQRSDVAPLWRAMYPPWDRAERGIWEGQEVYRVSDSKYGTTLALVTREPPHACMAIEHWMRGSFESLVSRSIFHWKRLDDWPRGLSAYEYVDQDGQNVQLRVKRLEIGSVTDQDFPGGQPRLRPGTWLLEFQEPPPGEQFALREYLWISTDRKIPEEALPPGFLERLAIGEATLGEITGGPPRPIWPIVVGIACAVAILASVGRWAYKRLLVRSGGVSGGGR